MIHVKIDKQYAQQINRKPIRDSVRRVLAFHEKGKEIELSVLITNDQEIRELNRQYRSIDNPTDVLAFPLLENNPETGHYYLGDIIVSYQTAELQAKDKNHSTINEVQLLVVHGTLHLLGYDHHTTKEKENMWRVQSNILSDLEINAIEISES
jgi:probable rRNA maturation factor